MLHLLAAAACVSAERRVDDPGAIRAVVAAEMPTVVHVQWTSAGPSLGSVEVSGLDVQPPAEASPTEHHDLRVLGLREETEYVITVLEDDGQGPAVVGTARAITGALDPAILPFRVDAPVGDDGPAYFLTSVMNFNGDGYDANVWVVDNQGFPVWGTTVADVFPMFPTWDPTLGVRALSTDFVDYGGSRVDQWGPDGDLASYALPGGHHEALWLPDGTMVYTRTDSREVDGELLGGDQLVERAPGGSEITVWDAFAAYPTTHNDGWEKTKLADEAADWTHANGIALLPDEDDYLVSLYYPEAVVRVDRASGGTEWILGGADSDFAMAPEATFGPQHSPRLAAGGVMVFDNGNSVTGSRLVEVSVDAGLGTASLAWEWRPDPLAWNLLLGHVEPAGDGLVASWGMAPDIYVYDADRELSGHLALDTDELAGALGAVRGLATLY